MKFPHSGVLLLVKQLISSVMTSEEVASRFPKSHKDQLRATERFLFNCLASAFNPQPCADADHIKS